MYNYTMLIGRICNDLELKEVNEQKVINITLAVQRPFKKLDGEYETDFFQISCWNFTAEAVSSYCKKGMTVGIKGRLQPKKIEVEGKTYTVNDIIAEKIMFL